MIFREQDFFQTPGVFIDSPRITTATGVASKNGGGNVPSVFVRGSLGGGVMETGQDHPRTDSKGISLIFLFTLNENETLTLSGPKAKIAPSSFI